ncbi:SUMF1/EgtB/PvdO family nonheme iron enzyme [Tolypothrix sp. FACHB-123]|nr:SUMF1/EgtB/PvdO family nonheme iron enzyme [Tolypothrix sp. FACHB-123]
MEAIERIASKRGSFEPTSSNFEPVNSSSRGRSASNVLLAQQQEEHRQNLVKYEQAFSQAIEQEYPLSTVSRKKLTSLQQSLQLTNEEVVKIEQPIFAQKRAEYSQLQEQERIRQQQEAEYQQKLRQYEQEFIQAVEQEFPLNKTSRRQLKNLQESLQLPDKEVSQIEQPIIAQKEAEYKQQQERIRQQQEAEKQRQQEAVRLKRQEAEKKRQREEAEYRQKLQQYEQRLITIIRGRNSLDSYDVRLRLKILQWTLGLKQAEITAIETTVIASYVQPNQSNLPPITRQKFLKWAGLGSAGLVTAVVGRKIFNEQPPTPTSTLTSTRIVEFETVTVNKNGKIITQNSNKQAKSFKEDLGNGITLEMVFIPGGSFKMGSPSNEKGRREDESPQHDVNVPAFFIGRFEVTQEQYQQVMGKNPSNVKREKRPVEQVSWNDAAEFCKKLSDKTGRKYRLPSEAEWEYACRAGTTTPFYFGETITTELANYNGNYTYASEPKGTYRDQTTEVGSFPPNDFGLYDMHGNVWEWCLDTRHTSYKGAPTDGSAWIDDNNSDYQMRGGALNTYPQRCRSAYRNYGNRGASFSNVGFRVVCASGRIL